MKSLIIDENDATECTLCLEHYYLKDAKCFGWFSISFNVTKPYQFLFLLNKLKNALLAVRIVLIPRIVTAATRNTPLKKRKKNVLLAHLIVTPAIGMKHQQPSNVQTATRDMLSIIKENAFVSKFLSY